MLRTLFFNTLLFSFAAVWTFADVYSVKEYGAVGDGTSVDSQAIQNAINDCAVRGGGEVLFPAGDYLSGELRLRDKVSLHLTAGATLWASTDPAHYGKGGRGRLLTAQNAERIAVFGRGTIHGQGVADYGSRWGKPEAPPFRTGALLFEDCRFVSIQDVTILYSDSWTLHLKRCENVTIDGVTIFNNIRRLNSDGIDPNSCKNVRISNCHVVAGDDCIVLKSTEAHPCENVVVSNCTLETTTTALKLGTESRGDFRDIHFSNCTIKNTRTGIGFFMKDGTVMERVTFSDISIETPREHPYPMDVFPIFMDIEKRHADSPIGTIRDVVFQNIQIHSGSGILIQGMPESPIENLTLDNITFRAEWADDCSKRKKAVGGRRTYKDDRDTKFASLPSFITLAHVNGFHIDNVQLTADRDVYQNSSRSVFYGWDCQNGIVSGLHQKYGQREIESVRLHDCGGVLVTNNLAAKNTTTFLTVGGDKTGRISLSCNDLRNAVYPVVLGNGVEEGLVRW